MDDARFALTVALTAARSGATILNHASVTAISKEKGCDKCSPTKITGVCVTDQLTEKKIGVHTKCVINATGLFADDVRKLDDKCAKPMCTPSIGVHVVLPGNDGNIINNLVEYSRFNNNETILSFEPILASRQK